MFRNVITISGKPGCGKSTVADLLSEKLGYRILSSGDEMRKLAKKNNMSIVEFVSNYLPKHRDEEIAFDESFLETCKTSNNIIIPTRMMSQILDKNDVEHFKVFLYASKAVRVARVVEREHITMQKAREDSNRRDEVDTKRYKDVYNIDINDLSVYNLILYTHFTGKNIGKIRLKINYGNSSVVKYVKAKDTLPSTLVKIIINEYNEYVRRIKTR